MRSPNFKVKQACVGRGQYGEKKPKSDLRRGGGDPLGGPWIAVAVAPRIQDVRDWIGAKSGGIDARKGFKRAREIAAALEANLNSPLTKSSLDEVGMV